MDEHDDTGGRTDSETFEEVCEVSNTWQDGIDVQRLSIALHSSNGSMRQVHDT